jgi:hypothetical protein
MLVLSVASLDSGESGASLPVPGRDGAVTYQPDEAVDVLRAVWSAQGQSNEDLDEAEGRAKVCRNMKDVSFDGMAEPGSDLRGAWRERLRREGKLSDAGGSIRDLVLGDDARGATDDAE